MYLAVSKSWFTIPSAFRSWLRLISFLSLSLGNQSKGTSVALPLGASWLVKDGSLQSPCETGGLSPCETGLSLSETM
jgi:hypothetical protein